MGGWVGGRVGGWDKGWEGGRVEECVRWFEPLVGHIPFFSGGGDKWNWPYDIVANAGE